MTYESAVLARSPMFLWMFQEGSGTTAADATGNGNAGTYNQTAPGGYTLAQSGPPGVASLAVAFDESSSGQVFSAATFAQNFPLSADGWFKTTSTDGGGIITFGDTTFAIWMRNDGTIGFGVYDGSNFNSAGSAGSYNDGAWHYVGAAYNHSTTTGILVVDGAQVASFSSSTIAAGNEVWYAGFGDFLNGLGGTNSDFLTGTLCAIAAYPTALSAAQLAANYAAGSALTVTTASLPYAFPAVAYSATLAAAGGTAPYTWSITAGSLPGWASLNSSTGVITGTPSSPGSAAFTVEATDAHSATATQPLTLTVRPVLFATSIAGSGTGQYLADQHGNPWLCRGDSVWGLALNAGVNGGATTWESDIQLYMSTRAAQGFNATIIDGPCGNTDILGITTAGFTWDGVHPWASDVIGNLNDPWWDRMDLCVTTAATYGITVFLDCADFYALESGGAMAGMTAGQATTYGAALASRYASAPNIIWLFGNDYNGGSDTLYTNILAALRSGGDTHLVTIENQTEGDSRQSDLAAAAWAWGTAHTQVNFVYTYCGGYPAMEYAYAESPSLPVLWGDGWYEGASDPVLPSDAGYMRNLVWWGLTSGSRGYVYGRQEGDTGPSIWAWNAGASATLTTNTFDNVTLNSIWNAFQALPRWQALVPDTAGALVTGGRGTALGLYTSNEALAYTGFTGGNNVGTGQNYYVTASITHDGSLAILYLPDATGTQNGGPVTVNQSRLPAGYTASWMDPLTGALTPTTPGSSYSTVAVNSGGGNDWVLVLQGTQSTGLLTCGII